jgi:hypothetical protein
MVTAFATGDILDCHEYVSASYVDHQGRGGLPLHGLEGFRQVVGAAHRTTKPELSVEDLVTSETRAVARLRWRFIPSGEGSVVERETIEIVRVEKGQAVEHWGAESWSRTLPVRDE